MTRFKSKQFFSVSNMFPRNRMFIGLDVSHAGPMSFAERALNMPAKDPSVVGVSAHT